MKLRNFTLIEVVTALSILAMALGALMVLAASAQRQLVRDMETERNFIMLQQAAEYCMLQPFDPQPPPETVFDYPGYTAKCSVDTSIFMEHELNNISSENDLVQLDCRTITVISDADGHTVHELKIDCFHYDED